MMELYEITVPPLANTEDFALTLESDPIIEEAA